MSKLLIVGCGGFLGAIARYGLTFWIEGRWPSAIPLGTLAVNVLGCFALGALMAYSNERLGPYPQWMLFLRVGILGAFTTFSTFGYETLRLMETGSWRAASLSMAGNLLLGLLGVFLGALAARACLAD